MKIRCEQNSIRLRLRKSELVQLRAENWLESKLHFPDGNQFSWELLMREETEEMTGTFSNGRLSVQIPVTLGQQWMDTEQVAMECFLPLGDGHTLHILVEKDFPCKDRPEEDKTDFFTELSAGASVNC